MPPQAMSIGALKVQKNLSEGLCALPASAFRFGKRQRKKFQGSSGQFQEKTEDLKTEEARSEAADSSAVQNMERDAPWTAWIRMIQPNEEANSSFSSTSMFDVGSSMFDVHLPHLTRSSSHGSRASIGRRSCSIESRWRMVTVFLISSPPSPSVSKSTVMQNGVPISSWRR